MRLSWIFACTLVLAGCGGNNNDNGEPSIIPPDLSAGGGDDGGDGTGGNGNDDGGTLAPDGGSATPIRYVVVIVKENHTFDNYFMNFPGATSATTGKKSDGTTLTRPKAPDGDLAGDNPHSNAAAIIDNFFSTTAGPTSPGHFAIAAGQSPFLDNPYCSDGSTTCKDGCISPDPISKVDSLDFKTCTIKSGTSCIDVPTVVDMLPKGVTWRAYGTGTQPNINSPYSLVKKLGGDAAVRAAHFRDNTHLFTDLAND